MALVGLGLFASVALGVETQVLVRGNTTFRPNSDTTGKGYLVLADSVYEAACAALGVSSSGLTDVQKTRLSNEGTGGAFYTFVSGWQLTRDTGVPSWAGNVAEYSAMIYGDDCQWWIDTCDEDMAAAKRDFNVIKNGGSLGGNTLNTDYLVFVLDTSYTKNEYVTARLALHDGAKWYTNCVTSAGRLTVKGYENDSMVWLAAGTKIIVPAAVYENAPTTDYSSYWMTLRSGIERSTVMTDAKTKVQVIFNCAASGSVSYGDWVESGYTGEYAGTGYYKRWTTSSDNWRNSSSYSTLTYTMDSVGVHVNTTMRPSFSNSGQTTGTTDAAKAHCIGYLGETGDNNTNNWPAGGGGGSDTIYSGDGDVPGPSDDPVTPIVPPETPEIGDPIVDVPEPTPVVDPTPTPPSTPTYPTVQQTTDYTGRLDAIINRLETINNTLWSSLGRIEAALTTHCNHITAAMRTYAVWLDARLTLAINNGFASFETWFQNTYTPYLLQRLDNVLTLQFRSLESHISGVASWLSVEFDDSILHLRVELFRLYQVLSDIELAVQTLSNGGSSVSINLDHLADFDFDSLLRIDLDKLADFVADFDGSFDVNIDPDLTLTIEGAASDLSDLIVYARRIDENVTGILQELQAWTYPTASDYATALATMDGHIVDVLDAIEALDFTALEPIDYTAVLGDIRGYMQDVLVNFDDCLDLLDQILQAVQDLNRGRSYQNWDFPEPTYDEETGQWMVPVGTQEIEQYGQLVPVYRPVAEVLNTHALEDAFRELCNHFPFSMLNKLVQVALWITRPAIPPQFDLPVPNPSDWSTPYLVRIDLRPFDPVAAVGRIGILLWAVVRISSKTIDMWVKET